MSLPPPSPGYPDRPVPEEGVRLYTVGDIHGRLDLLTRLQNQILDDAELAGDAARKQIVYLGDYIDRGPESRAVIEHLVRNPLPGFEQVFLRGNHESMMTAFLNNPESGAPWTSDSGGGCATLQSYGIDTDQGDEPRWCAMLKERLPDMHLHFLQNLKPWYCSGDYFFCHAGVRPGVALDEQKDSDLCWIREEFLDTIDDLGKVVVHGHTISPRPDIRHNRIGIDTGAVKSGRLTCMVLSGIVRIFLST